MLLREIDMLDVINDCFVTRNKIYYRSGPYVLKDNTLPLLPLTGIPFPSYSLGHNPDLEDKGGQINLKDWLYDAFHVIFSSIL